MHGIVIQGPGLDPALVQRAAQLSAAQQAEWRGTELARLSGFAAVPPVQALRELCEQAQVDCAFLDTPLRLADFRLAVMDMDSTLITIECIDEIADMQGLKPQVAAITEAAMRGEIDFRQSLVRRVALLKGLEVSALQRVYDERLRLSPGAEGLIAGLKAAGVKTLLVSGGFTFFTERLKARLGLDYTASNLLGVAQDRLTGTVVGPVIDADAKAEKLRQTCALLGADQAQAIAIGDGANDLKMMAAAGVSVAYHAKPIVRAQARFAISHNGLDALLGLFN
ncbi:MAG TPA: phosphoserine phosphatase SerB [Burkholderiales bacterium]|jgi:phosphoserine phosphatase|nr:phosphoserine phosphatase SerB [Burkholderiales bacterium]